ncbi:MAG: hypothetical protein Q4A74_07270 [Cardiobacteriaceae bacterium]|nr:hypothetical protein [Cardiobacteriaceae bacterium]
MDWNKLGLVAIAFFFMFTAYKMIRNGGYRALMEKSRNAPQHWGTFVFLMLMVILFIYFLIRL